MTPFFIRRAEEGDLISTLMDTSLPAYRSHCPAFLPPLLSETGCLGRGGRGERRGKHVALLSISPPLLCCICMASFFCLWRRRGKAFLRMSPARVFPTRARISRICGIFCAPLSPCACSQAIRRTGRAWLVSRARSSHHHSASGILYSFALATCASSPSHHLWRLCRVRALPPARSLNALSIFTR